MSVIRSSMIYALANIASAGVPFLLLPILTRVLGPSEYGLVVGFTMLVTLSSSLAGFNAHAAVGVAWFNRPREEIARFVGTALALALLSTFGVALLVATTLQIFPKLGAGVGPGWAALAVLVAGSNTILQTRLVLWQSQQLATPYAILQVTASLLNIGLSLLAVLVLGFGAGGRNAAISVASFGMAALAVWLLHRTREVAPVFDRTHALSLLAFGVPLIPHALAGVLLGTTDRWVVSVRLGGHALGVYGAIAQLGMAMAILADAFAKAFNPWIYAKLNSGKPGDRELAVGAIYASIPGFLVLSIAVGLAIYLAAGLLLGEQFRAGRVLLPWFMLGGAFSGIYLCVSGIYFFTGRTGRLAMVTSSAALAGVALSWVFVANDGVRGAAIGYAATQSLLAIGAFAVAVCTFNLPWSRPALQWRASPQGGSP